jgi:16S rRNA processing protein RimM
VGEILRPRGIRGELLVKSQTDIPGRFEGLNKAFVRLQSGEDVLVKVVNAWAYKDDWVLQFEGVETMDAAERFRGGDLWIPLAERGKLADGGYFRSDLIGCDVLDLRTGERLGAVEGWQECGGPLLLEVAVHGKEKLIPFVDSICRKVDLDARQIGVELPEGLLDL